MHFSHQQRPLWLKLALLWTLLLSLVLGITTQDPILSASLVLFTLLLGLCFHSLHVATDSESITLTFGIGLIRKSIPRQDIVDASAVRNRWWYGWGIRLTPHGWMWNIDGLDAVELQLANGRKFRIGTDRPQMLLAAIHSESPS